jgi:hypothetical protein
LLKEEERDTEETIIQDEARISKSIVIENITRKEAIMIRATTGSIAKEIVTMIMIDIRIMTHIITVIIM